MEELRPRSMGRSSSHRQGFDLRHGSRIGYRVGCRDRLTVEEKDREGSYSHIHTVWTSNSRTCSGVHLVVRIARFRNRA